MKKIPVAIVGATGTVGQMFVTLLDAHPWFEVVAISASERSEGKRYSDAVTWMLEHPLPDAVAKMTLLSSHQPLPCRLCFSALPASIAGTIESALASTGHAVISNSKHHRMVPNVPLMIPEVNSDHLALVKEQPGNGMIITNPNCAVVGLAMALKPLDTLCGITTAHVVTLQALSGAGYPGVASMSIIDNIIPFISDEEEKVETEPQKILGSAQTPHPLRLSAQCTRVPISNGHTACISIKLNRATTAEALIAAWENSASLSLPSAPQRPIIYCRNPSHPQPRLQRRIGNGMTVSIGRLRPCPLLDWKFVLLSHNTIRGAAGGAILNAELLVRSTYWNE